MPRLRQSDCSRPGITRRRRGSGFEFVHPDGQPVTDEETLERIRSLAIPPAWEDVWICTYPNGHLQATGVDAAGRKQYRYHDQWRTRQDQQKFDEMLDFARALPRLRRRAMRDLRADWLSREQVLACAVRLLDHGFFRIGSEEYTEQNQSFGLATMLKSHVDTNGGTMTFRYQAKAGKELVQPITDPAIYEIVRELKGRRSGGQELLAYREGLRWRDLGSADINAYLKEGAGGDFSAKDFRTWNATVIAAAALALSAKDKESMSARARKRAEKDAVAGVAAFLGNTPVIARSSYIDPRVFDRFRSGWTIAPVLPGDPDALMLAKPRQRAKIESGVLDLLEERVRSPAIEKVEMELPKAA